MNTEIQTFNFNAATLRTLTDENSEPWFVATKHCTKADGTKFAFPPTVRITRKGLALLHARLSETLLTKALETTTD